MNERGYGGLRSEMEWERTPRVPGGGELSGHRAVEEQMRAQAAGGDTGEDESVHPNGREHRRPRGCVWIPGEVEVVVVACVRHRVAISHLDGRE